MPRTILLTGATDGLGRAVATELAKVANTDLILHGRNRHRLNALVQSLAAAPADLRVVQADLAEMSQVHRLVDEVSAMTDSLSVLVNNAGIGAGEPDGNDRRLTVDGNELRFAVNHLAAFALSTRLLPLLEAGAPARIVNVASIGQAPVDLDDPTLARGYSGSRAYGQSKLAMITTGFVLAGRLDPARVTVNSLHPATYMPTKMVLDSVGHSIDTLEEGVAATVRLILDRELDGITGKFYDRIQEAAARPEASDPDIAARVWSLSNALTR